MGKLARIHAMNNDIKIIRKEFRRSEESRYIHRLHGVLLVLLGLSTVKAGKLLGDPQRTIAHWVIQFRAHGLNGLKEEKFGRPEILSLAQKEKLASALARSPRDVGIKADAWTGAIVSSFLRKHCGVKLTARHCSRLLRAFKNQAKA
jgi:transposase